MLLALTSLAGCGGMTGSAETAPAVAASTPAKVSPAAEPATAPNAPAAPVRAAPAPSPEPQKQYPESATLTGLDEIQLSGLLGAPRFKRRDDPAEIWHYRNDACALDVFLYRAGKDGAYTVRHFETRGRDTKPVDQKDCFVGLLKAHEQGRAG